MNALRTRRGFLARAARRPVWSGQQAKPGVGYKELALASERHRAAADEAGLETPLQAESLPHFLRRPAAGGDAYRTRIPQ